MVAVFPKPLKLSGVPARRVRDDSAGAGDGGAVALALP